MRVLVAYDDAAGRHARRRSRSRPATRPETGPLTGDLLALRPKASRLKEVRIVTEGGTVLLDNVALTVR